MRRFFKKIPVVIIFIMLMTGGCINNHQSEHEHVYFSVISSGFSRSFFEIVYSTYCKNNNVTINATASIPEMGIRSLRERIIDFAYTDELPDEVFFRGFEKDIIVLPVCIDKENRFSWILVYKNQAYNKRSYEKYTQLKHFLKYIYSPENQRIISVLNKKKLPDEIINEALRKIDLIEWKDER